MAFVAGCCQKNSSFEFVTTHPTTFIQNSIKINNFFMTTENSIRNETISDYDRQFQKEKIDSTMQSWQLALAKHIEVTAEKTL
jgi:uncharacterized lipoprotein YajG